MARRLELARATRGALLRCARCHRAHTRFVARHFYSLPAEGSNSATAITLTATDVCSTRAQDDLTGTSLSIAPNGPRLNFPPSYELYSNESKGAGISGPDDEPKARCPTRWGAGTRAG